ncbi:MAG: tetratricopeptide repeat protein [Acidobacteria bacterium]|nr:tetratricopeptide repeat protein [Acidobacteriota bacterium]
MILILSIIFIVTTSWQDTPGDRLAESYFRRGVELQQSGDLNGARQAYDEARRLAPHRPDILSNLGVVSARLGRFDEAVLWYEGALRLKPDEYRIRLNLGIACFQLRRYRDVVTHLSMVTRQLPNHPQSGMLLGISHYELGEIGEAISHLEPVYAGEPGNLLIAQLLAMAWLDSGQPEKIDRAGQLVHTVFRDLATAEASLVRGSYALIQRDFDGAIANLSEALRRNPKLSAARTRLAAASLLAGNREAAMAAYAEVLAINRDHTEAASRLGWLYREEGRLDEAEPLLRNALAQRPEDPVLLYQLARLCSTRRQLTKALPFAERLVVVAPRYRPGRVLLARLYYRLGRTADAHREKSIFISLTNEDHRSQSRNDKAGPRPSPSLK